MIFGKTKKLLLERIEKIEEELRKLAAQTPYPKPKETTVITLR